MLGYLGMKGLTAVLGKFAVFPLLPRVHRITAVLTLMGYNLFVSTTDHQAQPSSAPRVLKGFPQKESTLLLRLRIGSAHTSARLHKGGVPSLPLYVTCQIPETAAHLLDRSKRLIT